MADRDPQADYQRYVPTPEVREGGPPPDNQEPAVKMELHRRLSIDSESDTSSVDEDYDIQSIASSIEDQLTWRGRMQVALHSTYFHVFIIILVVTDALVVLCELLLDLGAFGTIDCSGTNKIMQAENCHFQRSARDNCNPPAALILQGFNISVGNGEAGICECAYRGGRYVCVPKEDIEEHGEGVNPALVLHYISLSILCIFMVEVLLKLIAFRMKYFTHKFEVFDGAIVVISWILDIASLQEEEAFQAAQFIIILRLWRVVRIVNGAILSAKANADGELHTARKEARRVIHALHKSQEKNDTIEKENRHLKKAIKAAGLTPDDLMAKKQQPAPQQQENGATPSQNGTKVIGDKHEE